MIDEENCPYECDCDCECTHGGLSPVKATTDMTQAVGQRNGQLFTKPGESVYTAGTGITIDGDNVISVDTDDLQAKLTAGDNIDITNDVISATDTTYSAGTGITIDDDNEIAVDPSVVQNKLTPGTNINISGNTISAVDTTYSAGNGVQISGGVISAKPGTGITVDNTGIKVDETTIQHKLTAGTGITISGNTISSNAVGGVSSVGSKTGAIGVGSGVKMTGNSITANVDNGLVIDGDGAIDVDTSVIQVKLTAGTGITLSSNTVAVDTSVVQNKLTPGTNISISGNTISAVDTTYTGGDGVSVQGNEISVDVLGDGGLTFSGDDNQLCVDETVIQHKLTAGTNITISGNTISAVGTTYTGGDGVSIQGNEISVDVLGDGGLTFSGDDNQLCVDETVIQHKLTAGTNITISGNTISATGGGGSPLYQHTYYISPGGGGHDGMIKFTFYNYHNASYGFDYMVQALITTGHTSRNSALTATGWWDNDGIKLLVEDVYGYYTEDDGYRLYVDYFNLDESGFENTWYNTDDDINYGDTTHQVIS